MEIKALPRRAMTFLTDPRQRPMHAVIIAVALVVHLTTHYAMYVPAFREPLAELPYFRLHVLHEAEFLLIITYAGIAFKWKGALIALVITAITSVPFILSPYFFGRSPNEYELRDAIIQVSFVLAMGVMIVALQITEGRRRELVSEALALKEADEVKSRFVAIASHELRSPLTAIHGYSELMNLPNTTDQNRAEWARFIHGQSQRLADMLDDLLNVSNIQNGKLTLRHEPVNL